MMMWLPLAVGTALSMSAPSGAAPMRPPDQPSAAELQLRIDHLQVVGTVLYLAAHPDDENTRLLAWLVGERGLRTAYLSMTRGGGGQNLVGTEQAELLGVVRTGELLAARRIDGAEQRFSRARDFGYSKTPEETLKIWGHDEALDDVVRVVREVRPDVIITRFRPKGVNHGHHTASAILAGEAFEAAADPKRFPKHLKQGLTAWKTDRLIHNQSHWRLQRMKNPDLSKFIKLDVGGYNTLLGKSYGEIAAASRSMHKSQGFGAAPERGEVVEYFEPVAGTRPSKDVFEGLELTWARYPGTEELRAALEAASKGFDPKDPAASIPALLKARMALATVDLPPEGRHYKTLKLAEIDELVAACAGLWIEARAERATVTPGGSIPVKVSALARATDAELSELAPPMRKPLDWSVPLKRHALVTRDIEVEVPRDAKPTTPFWLRRPPTDARYTITEPERIGPADGEPALSVDVYVTVGGHRLTIRRPIEHVWVDPVRGELSRPVEIVPPVTASFDRPVVMAPGMNEQHVTLTLTAFGGARTGKVRVIAPKGWTASPARVALDLPAAGAKQTVKVRVKPGKKASEGVLEAAVSTGGFEGGFDRVEIAHDHLPPRGVLREAKARLVPFELSASTGQHVAYVQGSGDEVPVALRQMGYVVEEITPAQLKAANIKEYPVIVFGIRAFNVHPELHELNDKLTELVRGGGTVIVQYNTSNWFSKVEGPLGPYPFTIDRDRVTDETAAITAEPADHALMTTPNKLGPADFAGWVQERGLYFAKEWDKRYEAPLRLHDPGEKPLSGALLVAHHGNGVFIYTGLSFFRQLPAGVPGAYRLMANMIEHVRTR